MHAHFGRDLNAAERHVTRRAPRSDPGRRVPPERLLYGPLEHWERVAVEFGRGRVSRAEDPVELLLDCLARPRVASELVHQERERSGASCRGRRTAA